jgi:hypothetical protein
LADRAEALLSGSYGGWDVDDYEHMNPRDPKVRNLWQSTIAVGGLPEGWAGLDDLKKKELREVIQRLRQLSTGS